MIYFAKRITLLPALASVIMAILITCTGFSNSPLPKIAVANYGPHETLSDTIQGIKEGLSQLGFKEGKTIRFEVLDASFDTLLIPQMLAKLKAGNPAVLVTLTTPVAQAAKHSIKTVPIVFAAVTDPVAAGLLQSATSAGERITGVSDHQDAAECICFIRTLLPKVKRIGILYATAEINDHTLVADMTQAAKHYDIDILAIPVEQSRDVPLKMQLFKAKVDLIYVGHSGPIQPSLPAIVAEANRMRIPILNADADAVKQQKVLASFGVTHYQIGLNTAAIIAKILEGTPVSAISPLYPKVEDYHGYISQRKASELGIDIPQNPENITVVK